MSRPAFGFQPILRSIIQIVWYFFAIFFLILSRKDVKMLENASSQQTACEAPVCLVVKIHNKVFVRLVRIEAHGTRYVSSFERERESVCLVVNFILKHFTRRGKNLFACLILISIT